MKKTMKTKIVLALLMSGAVCMSGIYGAQAQDITINGNEEYNEVNLSGDGNTVTISNVTQENDAVIAGTGTGNCVEIVNSEFDSIYGAKNEGTVSSNTVIISESHVGGTSGVIGGYSENGDANKNRVTVNGGTAYAIQGGVSHQGNASASYNEVVISGGTVYGGVRGGESYGGTAIGNRVIIKDSIAMGTLFAGSGNKVTGNYMEITGKTEMSDAITAASYLNGENAFAKDNTLKLSGNTYIKDRCFVYVTWINKSNGNVTVENNALILSDAVNIENTSLTVTNGANEVAVMHNNKLVLDEWKGGNVKSVSGFDVVDFTNILWKDGGTILSITEGEENALNNAAVNVTETNGMKLQGGEQLHAGETMTLIKSNVDIGTIAGLNDDGKKEFTTTAGVAAEVQGSIAQPSSTEVTMTIQTVDLADQTMLVAENRAVAAAFVNQGTDLISDSLDTLSHDGRYGTKTFAAVYGNRSKYDVNSDLKINGWSTIVGVGNTHKVKDGDLSWGVFYENGTGNYRTYNSFNNEFFRGDGSLLYNGGGAAVRYNRDNGWYYEGSLRAGTLKSDMDNALMDGEGNHYGYSSESNYYGAHIGVGKVFSLSADRELDVYGKFFHTYTDGDSFDVAGDRFEFDDITSDRLRIGARIRTNPEERVSTYYGLAYEYEFNGDADMRAAGLDAPTQSLQGSTCMAELGLKYQPSETSPWNFDLNIRGYAGEREGGSFHAQVSYLF